MSNFSYVFILVLLLLDYASSKPTLSYSLTEQILPVARVGVNYSYTILENTFKSSDGDISYSCTDLPDWLSFNSEYRLLSGTPDSEDTSVTTISFTLVAEDSSGINSEKSKILLTTYKVPKLSTEHTITSQLTSAGNTDGNNGLVIKPGDDFEIFFSDETFVEQSSLDISNYTVLTSIHSPLPNWVDFDSDTLKLHGTAPAVNSKIAPSINYEFALIASEFSGYTSAEDTFKLIVGAHQISTNITSLIEINSTTNETLTYDLPLNNVFYDGVAIQDSDISRINITTVSNDLSNDLSWISIDSNNTMLVKGPSSEQSVSFNVTITDLYDNVVYLPFHISIVDPDSLFTSSINIPTLNVTVGGWLNYTLPSDLITDIDSANISYSTNPSSEWVSFNKSNFTFYGTVPSDFSSTTVTLTAELDGKKSTKSFDIVGKSTSTTINITTSEPTTSVHSEKRDHSNRKTLVICLGVIIPVFVLILLGLIIFFCIRRNKKHNNDSDIEKSTAGSPTAIRIKSDTTSNNSVEKSNRNISLPASSIAKDSNVVNNAGNICNSGGSSSTLNVDKLFGTLSSNMYPNKSSNYRDVFEARSTDALITSTGIPNISPLPSPAVHNRTPSLNNSDHEQNVDQNADQNRDQNGNQNLNDVQTSYSNQNNTVIPKTSWRRVTPESRSIINDRLWSNQIRGSNASLATVSTDELFSVRLVSSHDYNDTGVGEIKISTSSISIHRDDLSGLSGNVKQLDSFGNVVRKDLYVGKDDIKGFALGIIPSETKEDFSVITTGESILPYKSVTSQNSTNSDPNYDPNLNENFVCLGSGRTSASSTSSWKTESVQSSKGHALSSSDGSIGEYSGDEIEPDEIHKLGSSSNTPKKKSSIKFTRASLNSNLESVAEENNISPEQLPKVRLTKKSSFGRNIIKNDHEANEPTIRESPENRILKESRSDSDDFNQSGSSNNDIAGSYENDDYKGDDDKDVEVKKLAFPYENSDPSLDSKESYRSFQFPKRDNSTGEKIGSSNAPRYK